MVNRERQMLLTLLSFDFFLTACISLQLHTVQSTILKTLTNHTPKTDLLHHTMHVVDKKGCPRILRQPL
jgi:hypothetical protein